MNRRNWLSALLAVMMVFSMLTVVAMPAVAATEAPADAVPATDVSSSQGNSFTISNFEELIYFAKNFTKYDKNDTVYLTTDLDINDYSGDFAADFPSIGENQDSGKYYKCTFDGLGHTISNYRDSVGFIKGIGGTLCNITFENCSTDGTVNEGVIIGCNAVAKGGLVYLENVHAINCTVISEDAVSNVGIVLGYQNGGTRNMIVNNCSVRGCTIDVLGKDGVTDCYGTGLFSARWAAGGRLYLNNVIVSDSKLYSYSKTSEGGGLLIGDIDPKEPGSNCDFQVNNLALMNVEMKNQDGACAALVTTYRSRGEADIIGQYRNVYVSNVVRTIDAVSTPLTNLEVIKDAGSKTTVTENIQLGLAVPTLHDMLLILNENRDCTPWGYAPNGNLNTVDYTLDQKEPHVVTITYMNHKEPGDVRVDEQFFTSIYGTLVATEAQMKLLNSIPKGIIPGYEYVNDWSTVVFNEDATVGTVIHNLNYSWDEENKTHSAFCCEGCEENAVDAPCTPVLIDYHTATYFEHESAVYVCEKCKNKWSDPNENGASVSPYFLEFDKKEYKAGDTVKVRVGVNENTRLNGIVATISFDPNALSYTGNYIVGSYTADPSIQYTCMVEPKKDKGNVVEGELVLTVILPELLGTIYKDTWVTLEFTAKNRVISFAEAMNVNMTVTDYARIGEDGAFLDDTIVVTEQKARCYLLPATGVTLDFTPGDVNGNGVINVSDVMQLMKFLSKESNLSATQMRAANVNGDNLVSVDDASQILRYIVDGNTSLEPSYTAPGVE